MGPLGAEERAALAREVGRTSMRRVALATGFSTTTVRRAIDGARLHANALSTLSDYLRAQPAATVSDALVSEGRILPLRVVGRAEAAQEAAAEVDFSMLAVCCEPLESAVAAGVLVGARGRLYLRAGTRAWFISFCPWCGEGRT